MAENLTVQLPTRLAGKARTATPFSGYERGQNIPRDDRFDANQSIQTLRTSGKAGTITRALFENNGTISTAISQFVAMANTEIKFDAFVTGTNEYSPEGLVAVETVLSGLSTLWNYTTGYSDKKSLESLKETLLLEVCLTGACAAELVLDSYRIPQHLVVIPYDSLEWRSDGKGGKYPVQRTRGGDQVELKYPNVFVAESMQQASRRYALPLMISGLSRLITYEEFVEDMRRVIRQSGQPRILVKLDYEKVRASAPVEISMDKAKLSAYLTSVRTDMENLLSQLSPEDSLIYYDIAEVEVAKTDGEKADYRELLEELSGLAASALKTNPSALGLRMGSGSQNVASTEAMLTTKLAATFQKPVETVLSRALTLAVRLFGVDCYIRAKFEEIDLRPSSELESHKAIRQNRILELLSLGRITDAEAQSMLGLTSLPEGAEELSGSGFYNSKAPDTTPVSKSNARNMAISPDGPSSAGGKDNAQRP